ncbi:MAG: FHA domain-containing protein, partial [Planctomycetota bacterium]
MALLRVLSGENKNKIFALEAEKMVIGRESDQIAVLDQGVSRNHAEVFRIGELYFIRDLKSRNGTFVNDSRIEDPELLRAGDRVHLGNTVLAFEDQFPRPHDSRVIHLQDTTDTPASTLSFRLPVKDESSAEPAPPDAQEHARLQTLYTVSRLLGTGESLSETMDSVAREMCRALNANHVYLFAFKEKDDGEEEFQLVAGHDEQPAEGMMLSRSVLRRVRAEGRPILSSDAMLDDRFAANQSIVIKKIKSLLCVPLLVMNNPIGAFYATNDKVAEAFSAEDLELATTIGMLVGNSLEMWETLEREGSFYRNVLKTIAAATEVRTPENRGKAERVANHAAAMAGALGFSDKRTRRLWIAGLLHDIGAMALTEDELKNAVNLEQRKAKHAGEL